MNSDNKIRITVKDFLIDHVLECGQCFRYYSTEKGYILVAYGKVLEVSQQEDCLVLGCSEEEYVAIWRSYFDLERDYSAIKSILSQNDTHLKAAAEEKHGIRLLRQDPWEMLISFIISQTKQIPHIKAIIEAMSQNYGTYLETKYGKDYYAFPTPLQLSSASMEDLMALKVGFRAPYIWEVTQKVVSGELNLETLKELTYEEAKGVLMSLKGVGGKVSDCVLLFAYGKYEVFPTDVWVKRVVEHYYFEGEVKKMSDIQAFAKTTYRDLAGFAQQYLFYHARDNKIGK